MIKKFKKGDQVILTSGRDKGQSGPIVKIMTKANLVVVQGVNLYKRHIKPTQNKEGGIKSIERPLSFAKIALLVDGKPVRVGLKRTASKVIRINKKTGKTI